jgi:glutamine amidotransferase/cyclase
VVLNSTITITPANATFSCLIILKNVSIPVIVSSGAGKVEHFSEVFEKTDVEAALAAGIFHREEVPIEAVKLN